MKRGILGGTFDPAHLGHLLLAETAREVLGLDRVTFVPAAEPWRKAARSVSPAEHRLAMVRLAIAGNDGFDISTIEIDRGGPSYTADTLADLQNSGDDLYLILGGDALADLPHWRRAADIPRLARIVVAARFGVDESSLRAAASEVAGLAELLIVLPMPLIEISATDIRRRARQGLSLRYRTPEPVARYIGEHALYPPGSADEPPEPQHRHHL